MTLIVSPGEDVLSSSSDDGDSGCLAGSPDLKDDSHHMVHHEIILASKLKRLSLQDVKTLQVTSSGKGGRQEEEEEEEEDHVLATSTSPNVVDLQSDIVSHNNHANSDNGSDCIRKKSNVFVEKQDVVDVNGSSRSHSPVVIYECTVSVDSIPSACGNNSSGDDDDSNEPKRKLEGPAIITTPIVQLASQINCSVKQTSMLTTQLMACNNNNNNSKSLMSSDVTETLVSAHPPPPNSTSGKCSENGDRVGGYSGVAGSVKGDGVSDVTTDVGTAINGCNDSDKGGSEKKSAPSIISEYSINRYNVNNSSLIGNDVSVGESTVINSEGVACNIQHNSPSSEEVTGKNDIHRAKEKINLLRQNFLSSLSAEDDCDPPDFIVLPYHSDKPQEEEEEWEVKEKGRREEEEEEEEGDRLNLERKGKLSVEGFKVIGGSECGSYVGNGGDFQQEVGEEEEEEEVLVVVPGAAGGFSDGCQAMQSPLNCAFYDTEHLPRDDNNATTAIEQDNTSLDNVPYVNVLPAKNNDDDDERISSIKLLVSEASARLLEHEMSGRVKAISHVSSDITMCGNGNIIPECDITPETTMGRGGNAMPPSSSSSFVVNIQNSPPSELPPSLPPSPPPPPSSPQSPNLFTRDASGSPPNYLKTQSANFVNLLMLQSRKHKRLHRLRLPECSGSSSSPVTDLQSVEGGEEVEWRARSNNECENRLQLPLPSSSSSPPAQTPPQHHGNPHVQQQEQQELPPSSTAIAAINAHCGTTIGQLCHPGSSQPSSSAVAVECHHQPRQTPPPGDREGAKQSLVQVPINSQNDNQRKEIKSTSIFNSLEEKKLNAAEHYSENECKSAGASEHDSCYSDNSCLGYLNFDHESFVDSDNEYDIEQKNKLKEACKDIARALNTLPSPLMEEDSSVRSQLSFCQHKYRDKKPQYRDQQVEAHLSDTDDQLAIDRLSVQVRSCGTSTASDDDRRNSLYDNCGMNEGHCECGRYGNSDLGEHRCPFPPLPPPPPPPSSPPPPPKRILDRCRKPRPEKDAHSCGSDYELEDEGFRTDAGDGCRTDEFDVCTTSDDNDYDDYCQTDDCGEECDYCSGDDAEDEAEDTCYFCEHSQNVTPVCKHPGVITNGILKSFNGRGGREEKECGVKGVPLGRRSLALQAAIHRRRLTRQGLVAIRESSITSDELPESEEEQSYDGSNCDISSSWRFGLCRDITMSRDSTLRSVHSDRSSSSLPVEQVKQRLQEKSNSLPGANSRSMAGDLPGRHPVGNGTPLRHVSTSDDESGSHSSLPRLPPRPPRAPRMRPPLTPSPPAGGSLITAASPIIPRPAMGLQGLQQQRSPGTPRALHVSGLPVAPRTVAPRSPSNPNPPYGFPAVGGGPTLLCPGSPGLAGRSTPSPGGGSEGPPASPRISSRAGALVTRNFSISDDEGGGRWAGGRRHVTITRHESVYKEVAEKGYHLPPGSPVDPYWLTWKLGVLQKTVEEVSGRLEEAQKTADGWGPLSQDANLADQHAHNVRKFREGLAELQRGVDDVNDQAARFSAHNVPLTPANSAKLHDLNNRWKSLETAVNDRWRQVANRSREVTPLTPAQLASSVSPPWERATTSNKVPYYINHDQESTHWDHPLMMDLLDSMNEFNHIKFSAYRTATKLRILQKKLALDLAKLQMATDIFDEHGLRGQNDRLIDVGDMVVVLSALYANISAEHPEVNTTLAMDLCLNWLLNVYDSQRTGQMRVLSFKIGLVGLCWGHLEEKYRYMFRLIADPNRLVDQRKLGLLLHDCVQVPRQLGEVAAFGGSNIEPSVRSCFTKAGKDRETIEAVHFLTWVQQEPQSLVWLAVLHRVAASENIQHQVKCNICKAYPIVGLRYRCLKCLSFDMCQRCFFDGRSGKSHKITHPMHEYCTATTAGEDVKDFTKALKNKFKSKRSLQKHTKKGYLPVQTVLEGDPLESPSPSPQHNVTSQDMHSRLELYASRLAEVELRTNSNSTPDSEDEHGLIAQYCQSLSSSDAPLPVPRSPLQIMAAVDAEQKDELEQMIRALEEENSVLQAEYDRLKSQQPVGSPPDDGLVGQRSEADMLAEAKLLRQHKGRLEARMGILEEHNRQLEAQLHRLRQLLGEPGGVGSPNKSGTLQTKSVTASQLAMDSPAKLNGHSTPGGATSAYEGLEQMSEYVRPPPPPMGSVAHVGNLFSRAGDLGKAVGTLVATMTHEGASDLPSDEEDSNASDTEEEKAV